MGKEKKKEDLIKYFKKHESFTTDDIHAFFAKAQPDINRSTVNWRIHELVSHGILKRTGRGVFAVGKEQGFLPVPGKKQKSISLKIKRRFPLINFCTWHTSVLNEFYHHIPARNSLIVEAERDAVEPVFYFLKESNRNTFKEPSRGIMEDFVFDSRDSVIVKGLISEAPLQTSDNVPVPALEKILVDLIAEDNIFFFLQGKELLSIFKNAFDKYTVNMDRLARYAGRRNKRDEVNKITARIAGNKTKQD